MCEAKVRAVQAVLCFWKQRNCIGNKRNRKLKTVKEETKAFVSPQHSPLDNFFSSTHLFSLKSLTHFHLSHIFLFVVVVAVLSCVFFTQT